MSDPIYIKLISGEELIGVVTNHGQQNEAPFMLFEHLAMINVGQQSDGNVGIQLLPYPFITDDNEPIRIYQSAIALQGTPSQDFINHYKTQFGKLAGFSFASSIPEVQSGKAFHA